MGTQAARHQVNASWLSRSYERLGWTFFKSVFLCSNIYIWSSLKSTTSSGSADNGLQESRKTWLWHTPWLLHVDIQPWGGNCVLLLSDSLKPFGLYPAEGPWAVLWSVILDPELHRGRAQNLHYFGASRSRQLWVIRHFENFISCPVSWHLPRKGLSATATLMDQMRTC